MSNNHIKKIDSIISDLQSLKEDLEGENNTEYEFWNVQAVQSGEREITVYWETYYNGIVDIQFYSAGESVWKHSAKRYGNRIHSSEEEFKVQFNEGIEYGTRYFRVVTDELPVNVESEVFSCELKKQDNEYTKIKEMVWGWWYDEEGEDRESSNTIKVWPEVLDKALKTDFDIVAYIGGFEVNDSVKKWKERLANKGRHLIGADPSRIKAVILRDEPRPKGWEYQKLEDLIEAARDVLGNEFQYTYSFTRKSIDLDKNEEYKLPQNTQLIWWNYYPFYALEYPTPIEWGHAETEQEFYDSFERTLEIARQKSALGCKFMITTQAFNQTASETEYKMKLRTPPKDAPLWYAKFISRNDDMLGALHFVYDGKDNRWTGAKDLSMVENYKEVYDMIKQS